MVDNDSANIKDNFDALEGQEVSLAGRLMSKRGMGKVSFCDLQDKSGRIAVAPPEIVLRTGVSTSIKPRPSINRRFWAPTRSSGRGRTST